MTVKCEDIMDEKEFWTVFQEDLEKLWVYDPAVEETGNDVVDEDDL